MNPSVWNCTCLVWQWREATVWQFVGSSLFAVAKAIWPLEDSLNWSVEMCCPVMCKHILQYSSSLLSQNMGSWEPTVAESFSFVLVQRSFPPMPSLSAPPYLASAPKQVLGLEGQLEVGCSPSVCEALGHCTTTEQSLGPNLAWTKERGKNRPCRFIYQASAGTQGGLQVFDFHRWMKDSRIYN